MNGKAAELVISEAVCFYPHRNTMSRKDNISTPALYIIYTSSKIKKPLEIRRLFSYRLHRVVISAEQSFLLQSVWD